jgi:hypothetical protein
MSQPTRSGAWSGSAELVTGAYAPEIQNQECVFTERSGSPQPGHFGAESDKPRYHGTKTVTFGVVKEPDNKIVASYGYFTAEALIRFSVNGQNFTRRVSIEDGTSISAIAEGISIAFQDTTEAIDVSGPQGILALGAPYKLTATIMPGTRATVSQPPTLTQFTQEVSIAPSGVLLIAVPLDAGVISVEVSCVDANAINVAQGMDTDLTQAHFATIKSYNLLNRPGFVQVASGVNAIMITNTDSESSHSVQVVWGIDG